MNLLFPEDKTTVIFNTSVKVNLRANKKEYFIGSETGILRKFHNKHFSGYEFITDGGSRYFLSVIKSSVPQDYDAAFILDFEDGKELTTQILAKCKKKVAYIQIPSSDKVIETWGNVFKYKKEVRNNDGEIQILGLRPPQIGALHAIQAHWSISNKAALVVMPTGTGKTETMLCLNVVEKCQGMLVIVPSSSLRTQLFNKFKTLGILKSPGFDIISTTAKNPVVGFLQTGVKNIEEADFMFGSNVIISTPQIITGILNGSSAVRERFMAWINYLIMDEAHHSQAKEWNHIKYEIELQGKPILLFTATPFRNDKKRLQGKVIYDYPLSLAQKDKYFKHIVFHPILEFNPNLSDVKVAEKAIAILKEDINNGYDHILMARVDLQKKAEYIFENIYKTHSEFKPVFIHSGISNGDRKIILDGIRSGTHKIIVCVDMLGEGFDLPQLKVCALHDLHKNITTSFQFFGRFTRESNLKLGHATIVANIADPNLKGTLKKLYQKDSDWDKIISQSNERIIESVVEEEEFFKNFSDVEIPDKIPLRNITPAMSTVVFRCYDDEVIWKPEQYKSCFDSEKYETVSVQHEVENLLVIISKKVEAVKWGKIDDLLNCDYDLYIVYLNTEQKLLYINSTNNSTTHNKLAEAVVGENISLFSEADIYKCLDGIFQLELFNLGLKSILDGPISFTMYAGNGIVSGLDELDNNTKASSNLFGVGYENGEKISIGCSSKGRVWTKLVKTIPDFCGWCNLLGNKLLDETIDTKDIFKFIQKPELLTQLPNEKNPVSIKWSEELYVYASLALHDNLPLVDYKIELTKNTSTTVEFKISSDVNTWEYQLELLSNKEGRGYKYNLISSTPFFIEYKHELVDIINLFYDFPPVVWFHDNSKLYNNIYFPFKGNRMALKGNLLLAKHISKNIVHKERFFVKYTVYDQLHVLNQILFKTLNLIGLIATNSSLQGRANSILTNFPEMPEIMVSESLFETIVYNRKNDSYRQSMLIARLLLLNYHPDINAGRNHVLALMFDMNLLWEKFVYVSLRKHFKDGVIKQQQSKPYWKLSGTRVVNLKPDVILIKDKTRYILDTKWKLPNNNKPEYSDLQQMYAYTKYFESGHTILCYPGLENDFCYGFFFNEQKHDEKYPCSVLRIGVDEATSIIKWQEKITDSIINTINN